MKATKALVAGAVLAMATTASATPSTADWTPATTYVQPFLVPHLTYDTYFTEKGQLTPDYGLTIGVLPFDKLQAEVGFDIFTPGFYKDSFQLNAKLVVPENAYGDWQPGVSLGIQSVGFKKDVSNYDHLHLTVGKTFGFGNVSVGGYYGAGSKALYTSSKGKEERAGFMASYTSPDIHVGAAGLDKILVVADYASGNNFFGAYGAGVAFYFTPAIDVIMGPVLMNDKALFGGNQLYWTVQLDVDFDLRAPPPPAPAAPAPK